MNADPLMQVEHVYQDLYRMAQRRMQGQPSDHSLQATSLVSEVYLKLRQNRRTWSDPLHFFRVAAVTMRSVLVDVARRRGRRPELASCEIDRFAVEAIDVDERVDLRAALDELHEVDARLARIARLRLLEGASCEDAGRRLGLSTRQVQRDWRTIESWLKDRLSEGEAG